MTLGKKRLSTTAVQYSKPTRLESMHPRGVYRFLVRTEHSAVLDLADDVGAVELEHAQRDEAVVDVDHAVRRHHVRHVRVIHPNVLGVAARAPRLLSRHCHARAAHELHLRCVRLRSRTEAEAELQTSAKQRKPDEHSIKEKRGRARR